VSLEQCLRADMSERQVRHRVKTQDWRRIHPGVYAITPGRLSHHGRYWAALLFAGDDAGLSHRSGTSVWGCQPHHFGPVHVTTTRKLERRAGIEPHWTRHPPVLVRRQGLRVTSLARTLIDLADIAPADEVELAIRSAERLHGFDRTTLTPIPGRRGRGRVHGGAVARGNLIRRFLTFLDDEGFAPPETEAPVEGLEVDAAWRDQRVIVEVDDYETHDNRDAMDRDRARDRALMVAGWTVLRITYADLDDPERRQTVAEQLRALGVPGRG
jgi:REase_MTES_1575